MSVRVEAGTVLFREGDPGDCAWFLERGEVEVSVERHGRTVALCRKGGGELFGEMAIVDGRRRSATVTTTTDCELIAVTRGQLLARLDGADPVLRLTLSLLIERLRSTVEQVQGVTASGDGGERAATACAAARLEAAAAIRLERELEQALTEGQFELHFQPIVALGSGRVRGLEALARWRHPERGLLPPSAFLPAAEANGFIRRIDAWAMAEACAASRKFQRAAGREPAPYVSVNVSAPALTDPAFLDRVAGSVRTAELAPGALQVEVTETSLIGADLGGVLAGCRALGVAVALDDFGTGYSSLSYLHRFPIDTLKLDRSFLCDALAGEAPPLLRGILRLAGDLGLPVVAEGIERSDQSSLLAELGAVYGQGFHFSKPVPAAEAEAMVERSPGYSPPSPALCRGPPLVS